MFGYIKAYAPELRVREHEYYRAAYCGLCRSLGRCCGCTSRLSLSYDFVFAALVRIAVTGTVPEFEKKRCAVHPFVKRLSMKENAELDYSACSGVLLSYNKCLDDIADERGAKRFRAKLGKLAMSGMRKKAAKKYPELEKIISDKLRELSDCEKEKIASADIPADIFGHMMAEIISYGLEGASAKIAREIGFRSGRWLYITDAADDCADDMKHRRYNPFVLLYGREPDKGQKLDIANALAAELDRAVCALDLCERDGRRDLFEIIENILRLGMPRSAESALGIGASSENKEDKGEKGERPL